MLRALEISNFRAFNKKVTIRIRPITILIGRNNAGKSSVIKFLRMLKQSYDAPELVRPSSVSDIQTVYRPENRKGILWPNGKEIELSSLRIQKNIRSSDKSMKFSIHCANPGSPRDVVKNYVENLSEEKPEVHEGDVEHRLNAQVQYTDDGSTPGKAAMEMYFKDKRVFSHEMAFNDDSHFADFTGNFLERAEAKSAEEFQRALEVLEHCVQSVAKTCKEVYYLSPVREYLTEIAIHTHPPSDIYIGRDGEWTAHHLWSICQSSNVDKYEFVAKHMKEIFEVSGIEFESQDVLAVAKARNDKTGVQHNMAQLGFGARQCLPVIVQGAIMHPYSTLMVEEPEAHLHPTAQLDLGGYYADLWTQRKVCSIVETHSGNLLLRLQRLVSEKKLAHTDVSIAFFDVEDDKVVVNNLDIDEDGYLREDEFGKNLPMEFFHANISDAISVGAPANEKN